jgi:hypothetical protein
MTESRQKRSVGFFVSRFPIFVYRFLATCHCRGGFVTRPSEIGTISALSDKNGMNMGGIAV